MTRPTTPGTSPLRGRYLVRNRLWNAWLRLNDLALDVFNVGGSVTQTAPPQVPPPSPQRILVAVGGHLGDAVLATSALRDLHTAFPRCELGVVTGSWNRGVLARHPRVRHFHTVDHWKTSRSHEPLLARWLTTRRTRALAAAEIRKVGYDAAIDLSPYYPNAARLLWSADIPVRIGYVSGGDGPLYTRRLPWRPGRHITEDHRLLVAQLAPEFQGAAPVCELPEPDLDTVRRTEGILQAAGVAADNF